MSLTLKQLSTLLATTAILILIFVGLNASAAFADDDLAAGGIQMNAQVDEQSSSDTESSQAMYRLYNPNSGEHFYTASSTERDGLVRAGWKYEGIGWTAPAKSNTPVYRLYSGTDHHYTTSANERDGLKSAGWKYEGIGWYSDDQQRVPLYRQFNPNVNPKAKRNNSGSHNYTTSKAENDNLVRLGWKGEGVGWYGTGDGSSSNNEAADHEHSWVYGESYDYYTQQRDENRRMVEYYHAQYNQRMQRGPSVPMSNLIYTSPTYKAQYEASVQEFKAELAEIQNQMKYYTSRANYYDDLAQQEVYCSICNVRMSDLD